MGLITKEQRTAWTIFALRVVVGIGFMVHGFAKWERGPASFAKLLHQVGTPLPLPTAWMVTLLEFFGGFGLLIGLAVPLLSLPLIASMFVAMFTVQIRYGFSAINTIGLTPSGPLFGPPGYEINLLYVTALLVIALAGPGAWSVDNWLRECLSKGSHQKSTQAVWK